MLQTRESIVWNPTPSTSAPADNPETSEPTTTENTKAQDELEAEKRQARAAKFGTSGAAAAQVWRNGCMQNCTANLLNHALHGNLIQQVTDLTSRSNAA